MTGVSSSGAPEKWDQKKTATREGSCFMLWFSPALFIRRNRQI